MNQYEFYLLKAKNWIGCEEMIEGIAFLHQVTTEKTPRNTEYLNQYEFFLLKAKNWTGCEEII